MGQADEIVALVLQGGGALGAYQGGAAQGIFESGSSIDWVAGISIGAINAAILCGNEPSQGLQNIRTFWERISSARVIQEQFESYLPRGLVNELSAASTAVTGAPGFFKLRVPPAAVMPPGADGAISFYDTAPLRETLLELVDFDRLNSGKTRLSVGAVNIETGNMTWFDNTEIEIRTEHIMASGALPPEFPPVEIDGSLYWDGGLVSNTPLQYVLDERMPHENLSVFQIDLFSARGRVPASVWTSEAREKDIRFSSRTRFNTDMMRRMHQTRAAARRLYGKLPAELRNDPDALSLISGNADPRISIAHLIYRQSRHEHQSKDYEFSRRSMEGHWSSGLRDARKTLAHPKWKGRGTSEDRIQVFDLNNIR
ncbi:DUF3734 domain-containing protein [Roseibium aggregatum]|uniref:Patatin-like phospholipase family protein n=1 Tax=Roseibium aggregatum TaxID=187304 RepID=A0A926P3F3_9HYPH|nr:patatin-like phospholipase family protein [Roseibium aggregatum]MBD1548915.1 patatin-like phospholipase family protein [Roseibium aggregatum]